MVAELHQQYVELQVVSDYQKIAQKVVKDINQALSPLCDEDYLEALDFLIDQLEASKAAKEDEAEDL